MAKRLLCLFLSIAMILGTMCTTAFAENEETASNLLETAEAAFENTEEVIPEEEIDEIDEEEIANEETEEDFEATLLSSEEETVIEEESTEEETTEEETTASVAKVGNTEYTTIADALANWTNGTTLTLLSDVTLPDVVTIKSTEHHKLDLGTYTMTAASGKHAIEITCNGQGTATYGLTVNADSNNPGGITATGKSCIYYRKSGTTKDRVIIQINGGVFNGSYAVNVYSSNRGTNCPQVNIAGGTFNGNVNVGHGKLMVSGGTFHGWINCTGDSTAYRQISGGRFKNWQFMTADAANKFWVGTSEANYNVGLYVDDEDYLVVGGPVIKEGSADLPAAIPYGRWSSYLKYSSAAEYGLFYTSVEAAMAAAKSSDTIKLFIEYGESEDGAEEPAPMEVGKTLTLDISDENADFSSDVKLTTKDAKFTIIFDEANPYDGTVEAFDGYALKVTETTLTSEVSLLANGTESTLIKRTYESVEPVAQIGDDLYGDFAEALAALGANQTLTLLEDVTITERWNTNANDSDLPITEPATIDGNNHKITFNCEICDYNNYTSAFRTTAPVTFKNLTVDMSSATPVDRNGNTLQWMRAISANSALTVEGCTFIGNTAVVKGVAISFGDRGSNPLPEFSVSITGSEFINWTRRGVSDNERGEDIVSVSVTGSTFTNSRVSLSAKDGITFTGNTLTDTYASLISYTPDNDDVAITATGNTLSSTEEDSDTNIYVYEVGPNISIDENVTAYAAQYNNTYYWSLESAKAAAEAAIAADPDANRDVKILNAIATSDDDTYYSIPDVAVGDQVTVTFDFGGGVNANNYISETFVLDLGASITAPTNLKRDGYIFTGWDKTVPEAAYASETYTAQWLSEDNYKFRTVLTPVGGTAIAANEIKIDPQGSFIVEVSIEDVSEENMAWNVTEVTVDYDETLFTWNKINDTVTEPKLGTLVFKVYGEDKADGKVAKQLSFTAKKKTGTPQTHTGVFNVTKATVDTGWAANTINATLVEDENNGTAKVSVYYTFDVTVGDGVDAPSTADTITDYEGTIKDFNKDYNYDIIVDMEGNDDLEVTYDETTGKFVIDNEDIVGDFTIDAVRTGIKGVSLDDVEVHEYVAGKYALVLLNADSTRNYAYNGALMYKTPQYDTVQDDKTYYGYLVKDGGFVAEGNKLNTAANKALALSKITLSKSDSLSIAYIDITGDVNGTGIVDVNDIQAAWNAYNSGSNDAPKVNENMELYFRADVTKDKIVNQSDVNAVIELYDNQQ